MSSRLRQLVPIVASVSCLGSSHLFGQVDSEEISLTTEGAIVYDQNTGETVATQGGQIEYGEWLLTADVIRFNRGTGEAKASGNVVFSRRDLRMIAESLVYRPQEQFAHVENFRAGNGLAYIEGSLLEGNPDNFRFEDVVFYPGEPGTFLFKAKAGEVALVDQNEVRGKRLFFRVGPIPFLLIPNITQPLDAETNLFKPTLDYSGHIGGSIGAEILKPFGEHFRLGGNVALTTKRGILFGPAGRYTLGEDGLDGMGSFISGYIDDKGEPGEDINGDLIDNERYFAEWRHLQQWNDYQATLSTYLRYWSDSEVTRDFYEESFDDMQNPDSFLDANYYGENWALSLFARAKLNDFQSYTERLPELRFTYFPTYVGKGFSHAGYISAARLESEANEVKLDDTATRIDAYYGWEYNTHLSEGISLRLKAGARGTRYDNALYWAQANAESTAQETEIEGERVLADLGADLKFKAYSDFDFKSESWGIEGLRHIIEPSISYRYTPSLTEYDPFEGYLYAMLPADQKLAYANAALDYDQAVFTNILSPIDLEDRRDVDSLQEDHRIRLALKNRFQTKGKEGTAKDLATIDVATDYYLPGGAGEENTFSLLTTDLKLTPAQWLEIDWYSRFDPEDSFKERETGALITIQDPGYWKIGFGTHFLRGRRSLASLQDSIDVPADYAGTPDQFYDFLYNYGLSEDYGAGTVDLSNVVRLEQYYLFAEYQLNENFKVYGVARYDDESGVFYEQRIGLMQRALERYGLKYEIRFYDGDRREDDFGISIGIDLFDE